MEAGDSYCLALSVDIDRFGDAYMRRNYGGCFKINGRAMTVPEIRKACAEARAKGLEVFPPCDNVDARGMCRGHEKPYRARLGARV